MAPIAYRPSSADHTGASPEGYLANLLLSRRIPGLATYTLPPPSPRQVQDVLAAWSRLLAQDGLGVLFYLQSRVGRIPPNDGLDLATLSLVTSFDRYPSFSPLISQLGDGITPSSLLALIPPLSSEISTLLADPPWTPFSEVDARVLAMARWFKSDFMRWVDPIMCPSCGGKTAAAGGVAPSWKQRQDGAGRVELHVCVDGGCGGEKAFARYGKIATLVKTREGRCGEFAHLFYAFLRVAGIEARYVWNSEDHVWAEYWSPALNHWVHVDPSEAVSNKPLLYARGWGKKQAFCLAAGPDGMEDVTRAYVDDWGACRGRRRPRGWSERSLRHALVEHTARLRLTMTSSERARLEEMDRKQKAWVDNEQGRIAEAEREDLGGRTSGPADWRANRDELGIPRITKPSVTATRLIHSGTHDVHLLGDAKLAGEGILLTSGTSQTSAAFTTKPVLQNRSFRCSITFRLTSPGSGEADGIAVVFSSERKLGLGGYGLGYSGLGGKGDFAVEIDTYRTRDFAEDPPTPHISVHSPPHAHHRHSIACTKAHTIPYLSDGRDYTLELVYHGPRRKLWGSLRIPKDGDRESEEMGLFEVGIPNGEGREWCIGVTGSCGGLWQKQEIREWTVEEVELTGDGDGRREGDAGGDGRPAHTKDVMPNTEGDF